MLNKFCFLTKEAYIGNDRNCHINWKQFIDDINYSDVKNLALIIAIELDKVTEYC